MLAEWVEVARAARPDAEGSWLLRDLSPQPCRLPRFQPCLGRGTWRTRRTRMRMRMRTRRKIS